MSRSPKEAPPSPTYHAVSPPYDATSKTENKTEEYDPEVDRDVRDTPTTRFHSSSSSSSSCSSSSVSLPLNNKSWTSNASLEPKSRRDHNERRAHPRSRHQHRSRSRDRKGGYKRTFAPRYHIADTRDTYRSRHIEQQHQQLQQPAPQQFNQTTPTTSQYAIHLASMEQSVRATYSADTLTRLASLFLMWKQNPLDSALLAFLQTM